ncbi:unnamed protein product, partial [Owenia fusiformis]
MLASSLGSALLSEFINFTRENGVTIPSAPSVPDATLQGVIGTAAQGGFIKDGPTAIYVNAIDLVDGQGNVRHFNEDDDKDVIAACKVHLGMSGIIYNTTVKVVPDTTFKFTKFNVRVQDLMFNPENIKDLVMNNDGLYLLYNAFNGATDEEVNARDGDELHRPPDSWTPLNDLLQVWIYNQENGTTIHDIGEEFPETWTLNDNTEYEATSDYRTLSETIFFPAAFLDSVHLRRNTGWIGTESEDFSDSQRTIKNFFQVIEESLKKYGMTYESYYGLFKWITHQD